MDSKDFQVWRAIQILFDLTLCAPDHLDRVKSAITGTFPKSAITETFPKDAKYTELNCPGESCSQQLIRFAYLVLAHERITNWVLNNIIWAFNNSSAWEDVRKGKLLSVTPRQRLRLWDIILRNYPGMSETNLRNLKTFAERLLNEFKYACEQDQREANNRQSHNVDPAASEPTPQPYRPLAPLYFGYNFQAGIDFIQSRINTILEQR